MQDHVILQAPRFPEFKPIELGDGDFLRPLFWEYQPQTSELTFTNLFMWRSYYQVQWSMLGDRLVVFYHSEKDGFYFLLPIGRSPRKETVRDLLRWLTESKNVSQPSIQRADEKIISEIKDLENVTINPLPDHFDYVYRVQDLTQLSGRKYHNKKNHINRFLKNYLHQYVSFTQELTDECIAVMERWCDWRECEKNPILKAEIEASKEALIHFEALHLQGGAILINDRVEAFSLGELLNRETAVIHVEKADPQIPELFTMINQQFCEHAWKDVPLVNREQDLGIPGLRQAKLSYHPDHMVEKFKIETTSLK